MTAPGGSPVEVANTGFPLGIMPDTKYTEEVHDVLRDTRLVLFTDGVTDLENDGNEMLGIEGLKHNLQLIVNRRCNAAQTVQEMAAMLQQFQGRKSANDDQAFVVISSE